MVGLIYLDVQRAAVVGVNSEGTFPLAETLLYRAENLPQLTCRCIKASHYQIFGAARIPPA